jgi:hypothetical protein
MGRRLRQFSTVALLALGGLAAAPLAAAERAAEWQLARSEDGVRVYTRPERGSAYDAFRAVVTVRAPFESLLAVISDTPNNCRWMHGCDRSLVLAEVSLRERYVYQVNNVPAPLWPRDMIMHSKAAINAARDEVTISVEAAPRYCDTAPAAACAGRDRDSAARSFVRIERAEGFYRLRKLDAGQVEVTWQMHAEPGGDVAGWMANMSLTDIPLQTLAGLRRYAEQQAKHKHLDLKRYAAIGAGE